MSRRSNYIDGNDNFREQNLRFVRNEFEDNINQYFGGAGSSGSGPGAAIAPGPAGNGPPPRDSIVVQPTPGDNAAHIRNELEQRRQFMLEVGFSRNQAHVMAADSMKVRDFNLRNLQRQRFRLSVEAGDSRQREVDAIIARDMTNIIESYQEELPERPRTPPPPSNIDWNATSREASPNFQNIPTKRETSPENFGPLARKTDDNFRERSKNSRGMDRNFDRQRNRQNIVRDDSSRARQSRNIDPNDNYRGGPSRTIKRDDSSRRHQARNFNRDDYSRQSQNIVQNENFRDRKSRNQNDSFRGREVRNIEPNAQKLSRDGSSRRSQNIVQNDDFRDRQSRNIEQKDHFRGREARNFIPDERNFNRDDSSRQNIGPNDNFPGRQFQNFDRDDSFRDRLSQNDEPDDIFKEAARLSNSNSRFVDKNYNPNMEDYIDNQQMNFTNQSEINNSDYNFSRQTASFDGRNFNRNFANTNTNDYNANDADLQALEQQLLGSNYRRGCSPQRIHQDFRFNNDNIDTGFRNERDEIFCPSIDENFRGQQPNYGSFERSFPNSREDINSFRNIENYVPEHNFDSEFFGQQTNEFVPNFNEINYINANRPNPDYNALLNNEGNLVDDRRNFNPDYNDQNFGRNFGNANDFETGNVNEMNWNRDINYSDDNRYTNQAGEQFYQQQLINQAGQTRINNNYNNRGHNQNRASSTRTSRNPPNRAVGNQSNINNNNRSANQTRSPAKKAIAVGNRNIPNQHRAINNNRGATEVQANSRKPQQNSPVATASGSKNVANSSTLKILLPTPANAARNTARPQAARAKEIGFCVKSFKLNSNEKFFINVCQAPEVPAPKEITDAELIDILESTEPGSFRVPMSISEMRNTKDRSDNSVEVCDIAINPKFLHKIKKSQLFNNFFLQIMAEALSEKYNIQITMDKTIILSNRKFIGTLVAHRVRNDDVNRAEKSGNPNQQQAERSQLVQEIDEQHAANIRNNWVKNREPIYKLRAKIRDEIVDEIHAEIYLPNCVSSQEFSLDIGEDRILIESMKHGFIFDKFVNYRLNQERAQALFDKTSKMLQVRIPVHSG